MARDYLTEIRSLQAEGPYTVLGECGGGLIAYEIAQQLRNQGQELASLILMDTPRPDAAMDFSKRIRFFRGHIRFFLDRLRGKGSSALAELPRFQQSLMNEARSRDVEYVRRSYTRTLYSYRPKPYFGKVTLLINEETYQSSPNLGWEDLIKGGFEVHKLPGDHTSYIRDHVDIAAQKVRECLEKARAGLGAAIFASFAINF